MKITRRQLKRIIKEEKNKLIREMNPDGTISADEEDLEEELMMEIELQLNDMIQYVADQAEQIGGGFRGPAIKKRLFKLMADTIHRAR